MSEAIAEHTDMKNPMALVTLDAEKAFDRVWHERLFQKLYNDALEHARNRHMSKLLEIAPALTGKYEQLLQCILDCSHEDLEQYIPRTEPTEQKLEEISRSLLYDLHTCRTRILAQMKARTSSQPVDTGT